jgi:regulator of sigma E protease
MLYAFFLTFTTQILPLFYGIVAIGILITFHELGHFLFCKLFSVKTPSFSIGFGPALFSKKLGETEFILAAIPLGGYVEIAGMAEPGQGEQLHKNEAGLQSFSQKPYYQQFLIIMGGIIFNFLFAYIAFFYLYFSGIPTNSLLQNKHSQAIVALVVKETPAEGSSLAEGDRIIQAKNVPIGNVGDFIDVLSNNTDAQISLTVEKKDTKEIQEVVIDFKEDSSLLARTKIGIHFQNDPIEPQPFVTSLYKGLETTILFTKSIIMDFIGFIKAREFKHLAGPITIIRVAGQTAATSLKVLLIFISLISINLAILNLIPLPVLDGGQLLFYTIEAIIGRPIPLKIREIISVITWILLLLLIIFISYRDIMRFFS